jgi:multidrug efflux pump
VARRLRRNSSRFAGRDRHFRRLPPPGVDWEIKVDRSRRAKYGIGPSSVGTVVQLVTTGLKLTDYRPAGADDAVDIRLRLPEDRRTLSTLDQLRIETSQGAVPISNFVTREPAASVGTLTGSTGCARSPCLPG